MKTVGLVTRNFIDEDTGEELAAVYVPTAPNPAGGYLEIVRVDELVPLDWTVDQVMAFVISGGTVVPNGRIRFTRRTNDAAGGVPKFNPETLKPEPVDDDLAPQGQPISARARDT